MEIKSNTAERLKYLMKTRNLKQVDILRLCEPVSKRLGISINKTDLSQYVNGKNNPGQHKLTLLGVALGVDETWLMGCDVPMDRLEASILKAKDERVEKITEACSLLSDQSLDRVLEYIELLLLQQTRQGEQGSRN